MSEALDPISFEVQNPYVLLEPLIQSKCYAKMLKIVKEKTTKNQSATPPSSLIEVPNKHQKERDCTVTETSSDHHDCSSMSIFQAKPFKSGNKFTCKIQTQINTLEATHSAKWAETFKKNKKQKNLQRIIISGDLKRNMDSTNDTTSLKKKRRKNRKERKNDLDEKDAKHENTFIENTNGTVQNSLISKNKNKKKKVADGNLQAEDLAERKISQKKCHGESFGNMGIEVVFGVPMSVTEIIIRKKDSEEMAAIENVKLKEGKSCTGKKKERNKDVKEKYKLTGTTMKSIKSDKKKNRAPLSALEVDNLHSSLLVSSKKYEAQEKSDESMVHHKSVSESANLFHKSGNVQDDSKNILGTKKKRKLALSETFTELKHENVASISRKDLTIGACDGSLNRDKKTVVEKYAWRERANDNVSCNKSKKGKHGQSMFYSPKPSILSPKRDSYCQFMDNTFEVDITGSSEQSMLEGIPHCEINQTIPSQEKVPIQVEINERIPQRRNSSMKKSKNTLVDEETSSLQDNNKSKEYCKISQEPMWDRLSLDSNGAFTQTPQDKVSLFDHEKLLKDCCTLEDVNESEDEYENSWNCSHNSNSLSTSQKSTQMTVLGDTGSSTSDIFRFSPEYCVTGRSNLHGLTQKKFCLKKTKLSISSSSSRSMEDFLQECSPLKSKRIKNPDPYHEEPPKPYKSNVHQTQCNSPERKVFKVPTKNNPIIKAEESVFKKVNNKVRCKVCCREYLEKTLPSHSCSRRSSLYNSKEKRIECEFCDKSYKHKYHLNHHIKTVHHEVKEYKCDTCGKEFGEKQTLVVHKRRHENVRPYACRICKKSFISTSHLHRHYKLSHAMRSDFSCDVCSLSYCFHDDLQNHLKTHQKRFEL